MSNRLTSRLGLILVLVVAMVAAEAHIAEAATHPSGYGYIGVDVSNQKCFYASSNATNPYNGYQVSFVSYIYKKNRSTTTGCSSSAAGSNFYNGEAWVRSTLYLTSDFTICKATGQAFAPSTVTNWGISNNGYNRSGACAGKTWFTVEADGAWSITMGNIYHGPQTPSFSLP